MTNLEQKMFKALLKYEGVEEDRYPLTASICEGHALVAAKIALELAEKAFEVGWNSGYNEGIKLEDDTTFKQFIQDYE